MIGLGDLPGGTFESAAFAVSGDGSVIVGQSHSATVTSESFIWDAEHGMRNLHDLLVDDLGLDLTGWTLSTETTGISDDGMTIVGRGINPNGFPEAWVAHIPEPSTLFLLTLGGFVMTRRRRERRWVG